MFQLLFATFYIIPNLYLFFRIRRLLINKKYRKIYTSIYCLLAVVLPLWNFFPNENIGSLSWTLSAIAIYSVPLYLHFFLLMLSYDILLLINRLIRIVPNERFENSRYKTTVLCIIITSAALFEIYGIINFNTIRISEYKIEIPRKSAKINHLKIAFASDFHLKHYISKNYVKDFVDKIAAINPDLMIFGGDIVDGSRTDKRLAPLENLLNEINTKYGVYTILGNHEHYAGHDIGTFFKNSGMKLMIDTVIRIDDSFNLIGRNDTQVKSRKSLTALLTMTTDSLPTILIDHRPDEIDKTSQTKVDVQFSGHTHNGQLFPMNLILHGIYRITWGYEKIRNTHFFVSSGIRLWGPPVRTTGKSEIIVVDIILK